MLVVDVNHSVICNAIIILTVGARLPIPSGAHSLLWIDAVLWLWDLNLGAATGIASRVTFASQHLERSLSIPTTSSPEVHGICQPSA